MNIKHPYSPMLALNLSVKKYLILNFVTGGLYFYVLQHRLNWIFSIVGQPEKAQSMKNSVIGMYSCLGMFLVLTTGAIFAPDNSMLVLAGIGFLLLFAVMQIIWAYQCRAALKEYGVSPHTHVTPPNAFFTLFIPGVLIIHSINTIQAQS